MRKYLKLIGISLLFSIFNAQNLQVSGQFVGPDLHLHSSKFVNQLSKTAVLQHSIEGYQIVQFSAPIVENDKAQLEEMGFDIVEYLPDYAFLVRGESTQFRKLTEVTSIYRTYPFTVFDKLSPPILQSLSENNSLYEQVRILKWNGDAEIVTAVFSPADLLQLAKNDDIRWIEPVIQIELFNDEARTIGNVNQVWTDWGFYGDGQRVGIADTGLDTGNLNTLSPDFAGRIVKGIPLVDGESWNDNHGHGTHVAGSLLGAGVQSGADPNTQSYTNSFAGMAPEAELVVQGFEATPEGAVVGLDADFYNLFQQAYDEGVRLHSNSWGGATGESGEAQYGGYPFGAQRADEFIYDNPDMAIFVAAGNSGTDGSIDNICFDGDGKVDEDSMASPGTAKNVITVGATENNRPTGGLGDASWVLLGCFFFSPIATDTIANNIDGMAAFSSRGPTDDGRIKPDIVGPGTNIISNQSHVDGATTLWAAHETNEHYSYSGGTSMATPIVAGMGTLVREWLVKEMGIEAPSAALLKALLVNGATNIAPGQYGEGALQEIPNEWPNSVAGWGRANLTFLLDGDGHQLWFDERNQGLQTDQSIFYNDSSSTPLTVSSSGIPLRINLVWTDPPASLSASKQLVNDLDLIVTDPDGVVLYGNGGNSGDRTNNVEGLVIESPKVGTYSIEVKAHQVAMGSQEYALVVSGAIEESDGVDPPEPPVADPFYLYLPFITRE